jgi:GTP-binding protein Era
LTTHAPTFRSGYVAIVGWPNVGKSTFLNTLIGMKLSIVSPRPQTTRESILGILNEDQLQMVFVDTPGWLKPIDPFQSTMKRAIVRSIYDDADVLMWMLEPKTLTTEDEDFAVKLKNTRKPLCVAINKIDLPTSSALVEQMVPALKAQLGGDAAIHLISAKNQTGLQNLKKDLASKLPLSPAYFPTDQVTDRWERFYVAELIREEIFRRYQQEVPHASTVIIEEFVEKPGRKDVIQVAIVVETEGQMKIVVGQKGQAIKELGQAARAEIEARLGRPVFLELKVKVRKNWRRDPQFLESIKAQNL